MLYLQCKVDLHTGPGNKEKGKKERLTTYTIQSDRNTSNVNIN